MKNILMENTIKKQAVMVANKITAHAKNLEKLSFMLVGLFFIVVKLKFQVYQ
jgi:hypothetical protein